MAVAIDWSPAAITFLVLVVPGRGGAEAGAGFARVRIVRAHPLFALVNDVDNRFGSHPLHSFGHLARFVLTFGVPVDFI
jgi:hypothetical protein